MEEDLVTVEEEEAAAAAAAADLVEEEGVWEAGAEEEPEEDPEEERYARKWLEQGGQGGRDSGIPTKYTPCVYFFKATYGCQKSKTCAFSHSKMFLAEPFAAALKDHRWLPKERRAQPPTYAPGPPKKHRRLNDEAPPIGSRRRSTGSRSRRRSTGSRRRSTAEEYPKGP